MQKALHETCRQYVARRLSEGWKIVWQNGNYLVLSSPDSKILRPVDLRNDIETLRPNAAGLATAISAQYPNSTEHWDKVDEASSDGDSTYIHESLTSLTTDYYNLGASSIPAGSTINSVTVFFRFRTTTALQGAYAKPSLYLAGSVTAGTQVNTLGTSYILKQETLTKPGGGTWAIADLANLQVMIALKATDGYTCRCTQVYVEVNYTLPVVAPTVTTQAVSAITTTTATGHGNITDTGGENASAWGTCLSTNANPTTADTVDAGSGAGGTGAFTTSIDGLTAGTLYHVRAYATNSVGTSYGADVTFTTFIALSIYDTVNISEQVTRMLLVSRSIYDNVNISELVPPTTLLIWCISVYDTVNISELVPPSTLLAWNLSVYDTINISEQVIPELLLDLSIYETVNVSEQITPDLLLALSAYDTVTVSELTPPNTLLIWNLNLYDTVNISEQVIPTLILFISVFDTVNISEQVIPMLLISISLYDTINISEQVSTMFPLEKLLYDTLISGPVTKAAFPIIGGSHIIEQVGN